MRNIQLSCHQRHRGRVSTGFGAGCSFSIRLGSGSRLVRLLLEWPSDVPGRDDLLGLSMPPVVPDTLRLKAVGGPAKLWRVRGVLDIPDCR